MTKNCPPGTRLRGDADGLDLEGADLAKDRLVVDAEGLWCAFREVFGEAPGCRRR